MLVLAAVALGAAGCGDDEEAGGSSDLTKFAPADAPVFVEGAIRPEGELKDSIDAILERFPDGDTVGDELIKSINESAQEDSEDFTYEDDIEPWLGERAAFYATSFEVTPPSPDDNSTTDLSYELSPEKDNPGDLAAAAVFDGVAVVGSEQGVKDTIDASQGNSLSSNSEYTEFREERESNLFFSAYADVRALLEAIPPSPGFTAQQRNAILGAYGDFADKPVMFGAEVTEEQATFDFQGGELPFLPAGASELLDAGFADSWLAYAVPDLGRYFSQSLNQIGAAGLPQGQLNQVNRMLQSQLGFTLDDLDGVGDVAFFAAGESLVDLQVGGLFEVPDAATRNRLLVAISRAVQRSGAGKVTPLTVEGADSGFSIQVPQLPVPINVAGSGDRVAIGVGPAAQSLLSGDGGLTGSASYEAALDALGDDNSLALLVEMEPIVDLVDSTGQSDSDFEEARPYLEAFDFFASGFQSSGGLTTTRFVVRFSD